MNETCVGYHRKYEQKEAELASAACVLHAASNATWQGAEEPDTTNPDASEVPTEEVEGLISRFQDLSTPHGWLTACEEWLSSASEEGSALFAGQ